MRAEQIGFTYKIILKSNMFNLLHLFRPPVQTNHFHTINLYEMFDYPYQLGGSRKFLYFMGQAL